jgi:acyl carrier protein
LAVERPDTIPSDVGLFELGLDSMTAVELTEGLQAKLGTRLPATLVFEQPTLQALCHHLLAQLVPDESESPTDELAGKSEADLIQLLEQELNAEGVSG